MMSTTLSEGMVSRKHLECKLLIGIDKELGWIPTHPWAKEDGVIVYDKNYWHSFFTSFTAFTILVGPPGTNQYHLKTLICL
jgi:hypothetical protein